jgi:TetR/AcrR family transcriptional repressor of bet genes
MPKLGMGPIRREQICLAAAKIISEQGFAGTTMRMVADEAGVSTGMLNHYFANRMEMLEETLLFVSTRQQAREAAAIEGLAPGERRLRALIRAVLPIDQESMEAWRVWIAAHGASVRLPQLRRVMATRNDLWYEILERALEGIVARNRRAKIPYPLQFDALMNGLVIQAITTDAPYAIADIERVLVERVLEHAAQAGRAGARNGRSNEQRMTAA